MTVRREGVRLTADRISEETNTDDGVGATSVNAGGYAGGICD